MEFINEALLAYCENHSAAENNLLKKLNRDTHLKVPQARMLSGHLQGRFLSMLSKLIRPSYILEIGTYTGYSALCLAEGLTENGKLLSLDINEETLKFAEAFVRQSPYKRQIELICGNAIQLIPGLDNGIDLVFIDADKQNYSNYFDLVLPKLNAGGMILADNVLWSGKVLEKQQDKDTAHLHAFNQKVNSCPDVEVLMLPIRDGLTLIRKR